MKANEVLSPVTKVENVVKIFGSNAHKTIAIRGMSLCALPGELLLLLGPSGSGKTTLLTLMAGLLEPTEGRVFLFGKDLKSYSPRELQLLRARRMGFIFQTFMLIDSLTALENISVILTFAGKTRKEARREAAQLLEQLGVMHLAFKFPRQMSQGEKQRVAVARAIANNADLIIGDEPTGSLETRQGFEIIQLLHSYAKDKGKCVIVASHDLRLVNFADWIIRLEDGYLLNS
jgi:putative ABC transport system ATP-binding protein